MLIYNKPKVDWQSNNNTTMSGLPRRPNGWTKEERGQEKEVSWPKAWTEKKREKEKHRHAVIACSGDRGGIRPELKGKKINLFVTVMMIV